MEKSKVKKLLILLVIYFVLSFAMWYGFDYLWEKYPEQRIFRTLSFFGSTIAYLLVFAPVLIIRNKKEKKQNKN